MAEAALLGILRDDTEYVSGASLCAELKVSRTAVWKRIKNLRKMGYRIDASRGRGYKLADADVKPFNGVEILSELSTEFVGRDIYFYDELTSTNMKASELAAAGAANGTVVISDSQSGGKGRLGRDWHSPAGSNLYTSIILRPEISPAVAPSMTLVFAVAVAEAIGEFTSTRPSVKWPNDILLNDRKVAGILTEMSSDMDRVAYIVSGIGVNINMDINKVPKILKNIVISLNDRAKEDISRAHFARTLYSSVEKWYKVYIVEGCAPIVGAWRKYFDAEGRKISVNTIDRVVEGLCMGIDDGGALLLREPSGEVVKITSGEMAVSG